MVDISTYVSFLVGRIVLHTRIPQNEDVWSKHLEFLLSYQEIHTSTAVA